jgi:hypothetical protein
MSGRFFAWLCVLAMLASPAYGAEQAASREYTFELVTLNLSAKARGGRAAHTGAPIRIDIASAMTDEEIETVKNILDQVGASPADGAGYRHFSLSNGTRGQIGFLEDPEVAGAGVQKLPVKFSVKDEFSTTEAALVLRMAIEANLFVAHPADPTLVATTYEVTDRPFRREHPRASMTADDKSLAEWIRQNIPARDVADESGR